MKLKTTYSFVLFVIVPTILATLYYLFIASDKYVVNTGYVIQSTGKSTPDVLGAITGLPGSSGDGKSSYIAQAYIKSSGLLNELDKEIGIRKFYSNPRYDRWSRLKDDASFAEFLEYWHDHCLVNYDTTTGITTLEISSFKPGDAVKIANILLKKAEQHVNRLSARAREDALEFSRVELEEAEQKLVDTRTELTQFRNVKNEIDPEKTSEAKIGIVTQLESQLSTLEAELKNLNTFMKPSSIKVRALKNRIKTLKRQINSERNRWVNQKENKVQTLSSLVGDYERLSSKKIVAERLYEFALTSMETARLNALQQHKYLEVISAPQLPDEAEKPYKVKNILTVLIGSFLLWVIGSLVLSAIKDHV